MRRKPVKEETKSERIVKDIRRRTRKRHSAEEEVAPDVSLAAAFGEAREAFRDSYDLVRAIR